MIKAIKAQKYKVMQVVSTVAVAVATQALSTQNDCILAIYEPKMPEALKQEVNK